MVRLGCLTTTSRVTRHKQSYGCNGARELFDENLQRRPHAKEAAFKSLLFSGITMMFFLFIILHSKSR